MHRFLLSKQIHFLRYLLLMSFAVLIFPSVSPFKLQAAELPQLTEFTFQSTLDESTQPALIWIPPQAKVESTPLFIFLHSWSGDYKQNNNVWFAQAVARNWIYLHPNFRGRNDNPAACGSELARQDILDCIQKVIDSTKVDTSRIYLAGSSGGGHMSMLMAGYYPDRFSAVSAWVGISDLAEWHRFHSRGGKPTNYARMIQASTQGVPGQSPEVDAQYMARSPIFHIQNVGDLPLDLNTGIHDGHTGSVPIVHTLNAFNKIAAEKQAPLISPEEIETLNHEKPLTNPQPSDIVPVTEYGTRIYLRRRAGDTRVTVFEGGHESHPLPACRWLSKQERKTEWMKSER
ncbi:prolyl oligopeptidase family serine peptidase [uncultured Rubinisphaera sp.]|uniref:alpha/beta hydrolase family protein n=1 Tax=uncultured Rubinisphaera sp. TaxID=1678686 RepID=UPI0030DB86E4